MESEKRGLDIEKLRKAVELLREKIDKKTFEKAVGGRKTHDAIKLLYSIGVGIVEGRIIPFR